MWGLHESCVLVRVMCGLIRLTPITSLIPFPHRLCPFNTSFTPGACNPVCVCQPGTRTTPGSSIACDGVDLPCNPGDVQNACGSNFVSCTKTCQYPNSSPSIQSTCVINTTSCVEAPIPACEFSGTLPCNASVSLSQCGPATQSCLFTYQKGSCSPVSPTPTCTCTATGVPTQFLPCAEWVSYTNAPMSQCQSLCGPGFMNHSVSIPCAIRQFWVPASQVSNPIPFLTTPQPNIAFPMMAWSPVTFQWEDNILSVIDYVEFTGQPLGPLSNQVGFLQCDCDTSVIFPVINTIWAQFASQGNPPIQDWSTILLQTGNGFNAFRANGRQQTPYVLNPYTSGANMVLLQGFAPQPVDNFYQVLSCQGPSVYVANAVTENTNVNNQFQNIDTISQAPGIGQYNVLNSAGTTFPCSSTIPIQTFTGTPRMLQQMFEYVPSGTIPVQWTLSYLSGGVWSTFNCPQLANFIFEWSLPPNDFTFTQRNGQINSVLNPVTGCATNQLYVDLSNLYSGFAAEQGICSSRGVFNPLAVVSALGLDRVPSYFFPTLNINALTWMIQPITTQVTNCNGPSQFLDFTNQYGPLSLASVIPQTCNCAPHWGGTDCSINMCCDPETNSPQNRSCYPIGLPKPPPYIGYDLCNWIFQYDVYINGNSHRLLDETTCPMGGQCNLNIYNQLANQYCVNGVPVYGTTTNGFTCQCNPGWVVASGVLGGQCTQPSASNCGGPGVTTPCGPKGQGSLVNGQCVCNLNWLPDQNGCCVINNQCNANCSQVLNTHIVGCNQTSTGHNWVCSNQTDIGMWTGECCNVFNPVLCEHGTFIAPQYVAIQSGALILPVQFTANVGQKFPPHPGINQNGGYCYCGQEGAWSGLNCSQPACPVINGQICNGKAQCINGQCMNSQERCNTDNDFTGCGCQFNLTDACFANEISPACSGSHNGLCEVSNTTNISYGCECNNGYTGKYCQNSPCGVSNCNAANEGGTCQVPTDGSAPFCKCDVEQAGCVGFQGCIFGGDNCQCDITQVCGVINNKGRGDEVLSCNGQGFCNVTNQNNCTTVPTTAQCICNDGFTGPKCQIEPCPVDCGPNGNCVDDGSGGHVCQCFDTWYPTGGPAPCSQSTCTYGVPSSIGFGATCQCNNTKFAYTTPCNLPNHNCTTLACNSTNGLTCSTVNCAINPRCQDRSTMTCTPGCNIGFDPCGGNTCFNGLCTCHWSSFLNTSTGVCDSHCAPWPQTIGIEFSGTLQNPVFRSCDCAPAFSFLPDCSQPTCQNGGELLPDGLSCKCPPEWYGTHCETDFCNLHGRLNGTGQCSCFFPYDGPNCQFNLCGAHGTPKEDQSRDPFGICACQPVYTGMTCEFNLCVNGGVPFGDGSACSCPSGYNGQYCQFFGCFSPNIPVNSTYCQCAPDWFGNVCQYRSCGPAGSIVNNSTCSCGGVSTLRNSTCTGTPFPKPFQDGTCGNCTGSLCGNFGEVSNDLSTCFCNPNAPLTPPDATHSFWCRPNCNTGVYNNSFPIHCMCPPGTGGDFCFPLSSTAGPSPTSMSSTGMNSSSSSTGRHPTNSATNIRISFSLTLCLLLVLSTYLLL